MIVVSVNEIARLFQIQENRKDEQDQDRHGDTTSTEREPREIRPCRANSQQHNEDVWETEEDDRDGKLRWHWQVV